MKVKVLSLLVPALLVAGAANAAEIYNKDGNKLDLYGKVDGLHYFSDDDSADGDQTYMRLGFKGETQVNDQLTGYGQWEYQIQGNSGENENNSWTRVAFAGLKFADAGSFDYGRNYGVVYDVTSWTDVLPEFGGDTYGSDNFMQQRGNGFATYRNQDFFGLVDGLNFALQYQGKNGSPSGEGQTNNGRDALRQNGDGYGGSLTYDLGEGFALGTAVTSSKRTADQNAAGYYGEGDRAETYTGGTCPPMLITKSTCWMKMTSPVRQVSVLTISSRWVWFTSSNCSYCNKGAIRPLFSCFFRVFKYAVLVYSCRPGMRIITNGYDFFTRQRSGDFFTPDRV